MRSASVVIAAASLALLAGCTNTSPIEGDVIGEVSEALVAHNGLSNNGLGNNGLGNNGLGNNGLGNNGLGNNGLGNNELRPELLSAVQNAGADGEAARAFIRHAVACALEPSQSFVFSWTDGNGVTHDEQLFGELGLAPNWATQPLSHKGKRMVSACLAAHVNFYGQRVTISLRSAQEPLRLHPSDDELDAYPNVEGAFWGNLWTDEPYVNACYNAENVDNSHDYLRECATGHTNPDGSVVNCGMINVVGPCDEVCVGFNHASQHYSRCVDQVGERDRTRFVITTALP